MRREGRPHGMVRSYPILPPPLNPRPRTRFINRFDSPPTAGLFTKLPNKPTNHSKFTGKCTLPRCNSCHVSPSSKSRHKAKGSLKIKSSDFVSKARPDFSLSGLSVTRMLDRLAVDDDYEDDRDEEIVTVSPKDSYSFADLFRMSDFVGNSLDDDEIGVCEGEWVGNEIDYQVGEEEEEEEELDGGWYFVESYS